MLHTTEVMAIFVRSFAYFGQNLVAMATPLRPLQSEMSSLDWSTTKTPFISNHILVICGRNAFIAILVLKLVAMVMPLCPLCMWVSQMNSPTAQALSQNQTLHGYVAYNWRYGQFCDFWPILVKLCLPWQRPLDPCNHNVFFGLVYHENPL